MDLIMAPVADNSIILSYHNTCIRKSDLLLLMPILDKSNQSRKFDRWLNDVVVSFAFEYFEFDTFHEYADSMAFLNPSVAQLLKLTSMAEDEINGITFLLNPLDLQHKNIIFVPINDHDSSHDSGGTHWSLAVFCIDKPVSLKPEAHSISNDIVNCNAHMSILSIRVYHYDSHLGISSNFRQAHCLAQKMLPFLVGPMNLHNNTQLNNLVIREPSPSKKSENVSATRTSSRLFHKSLLQRQRHDSNSSPLNEPPPTSCNDIEATTHSNLNYTYTIPVQQESGGVSVALTVQEVKKCPQQVNGFDCGMYCIALAETVGRAYVSHEQSSKSDNERLSQFIPPFAEPGQADSNPKDGPGLVRPDIGDAITPAYVARQRTKLYELILRLAGAEHKCKEGKTDPSPF